MRASHYMSVVSLIISTIIFVFIFMYFQENEFLDTKIIDTVGSVLASNESIAASTSEKQHSLEPVGLTITERYSIYFLIGFSVFICLAVILGMFFEKRKNGYHTVQLPLITVSTLLIITFIANSLRVGIF